MLSCPRMHAIRALTNLFYPPTCPLCHARPADPPRSPRHGPCEACCRAMPRNGPPACRRCGMALRGAFDAALQCRTCRRRPRAFERAHAPFRYAGTARMALRRFKYGRRQHLGRWLADRMTRTAQTEFPLQDISLILPVPLHWLKRRLRGWNPAEFLADEVARSLEKPCQPHALRRRRWTAAQTRLSRRRRLGNVQAAFTARPALVRDRDILLIDDVLTSGATADACARTLRTAGARRVFVLAAARTPGGDAS